MPVYFFMALCYLQVELDMSEMNCVSSESTLALAEHCKNLKMYVLE